MSTATTSNNDLTDILARALQGDRVQTMSDRLQRDDMVWVVMNPGSHTSVGNERFGPGERVLVHEQHAERLTEPTPHRAYPAARYLDDPEPSARGRDGHQNFPQVHGVGNYHPESKHHRKPKDTPLRAGSGQTIIDGQIVETGLPGDDGEGGTAGHVDGNQGHGATDDDGPGETAGEQPASQSGASGGDNSSSDGPKTGGQSGQKPAKQTGGGGKKPGGQAANQGNQPGNGGKS